jgi:hypothetical protein
MTRDAQGPDGGGQRALVLRSPLLDLPGVVHGFSTRQGGVSEGSFASLNFGIKGGDRPDKVEANLERLAREVGFRRERLFRVNQVHGHELEIISADASPSAVATRQADALITADPGTTLGVLTADCVPLLFADPARRAIAAAHGGWRGIVRGVVAATVDALRSQFGSDPQDLRVAIGPCIGVCCYEVGWEVATHFAHVPGALDRQHGHRLHLDLVAAVRHALREVRVPEDAVSQIPLCTRCREDLLFSYRRDGAATGHHLSVIGLV